MGAELVGQEWAGGPVRRAAHRAAGAGRGPAEAPQEEADQEVDEELMLQFMEVYMAELGAERGSLWWTMTSWVQRRVWFSHQPMAPNCTMLQKHH